MVMKKEVVVAVAVTTAAAVLGGVFVFIRQWKQRIERRLRHSQRILRKFARESATPVAKLWHIANQMADDIQISTGNVNNLSRIVSYNASLPTGEEGGIYYGINLRGANFLIIRARLDGKNEPITEIRKQEIPIPSQMTANADSTKELFDFIAMELAKFISVQGETELARNKKLGFTVSIPVVEAPLSSGVAFKLSNLYLDDTVGKELSREINEALVKHGVEMQVFAVVNDTIGDLAGGRYYSKESVVAVTLGMGTDVAYLESPSESPNSEENVVNLQWANFNASSLLPLTEFDVSLDAESTNPGCRVFEKLISGMYLGEVVRRVLLKMARETALFGDRVPPKLTIPYILRSPDMAAMHQDTSEEYEVVDEKLKEIFEISNTTPMVREIVAEVCDVVAERGARLVGAGIVGLVKKLGRIASKKSIITIEGGLYEHYRVFRNYLHSSVWEMLGSELSDNVVIQHAHGGAGAGSIFLAASQTTQK